MKISPLLVLVLAGLLVSCKVYKQDIMFQLNENFTSADLAKAVSATEKNYTIQKNDLISVDVFTNKGERITDPNFELRTSGGNNQGSQGKKEFSYLVMENGKIKLPVVGEILLDGLTINEAEKKLENEYTSYYKEPFVKMGFLNKRVIILGATGGQVISLKNENTSLVEILAEAGGLNLGARAQNIRLIRGDQTNPEVYMIDLTSIEGMKSSVITMKPGDIIYVEPWRRVWLEGLKDIGPILSLVSSVLTLALVLQRL